MSPRNPNDVTLSGGLNDETAQTWSLKERRTYQIQNKIYNEDIVVSGRKPTSS